MKIYTDTRDWWIGYYRARITTTCARCLSLLAEEPE